MKHTALSFAILFSLAGMTAAQAETPVLQQMPAITVAPAEADIPAVTVAPAATNIPAITVAPVKADVPVATLAPVETGTPATGPVAGEAAVAATTETPVEKDVTNVMATTAGTSVSASTGNATAKPMPGKGMRKCRCQRGMKHDHNGKKHDGKKHRKGCMMEHRRQMEERLDLIDARLAKIEAMLERLMRR